MSYPNDPADPESWDEDTLLAKYREVSQKLADLTKFAASINDKPPETLRVNTRSMSNALRDLATLLAAGRGEYVLTALSSLADRVEEMAREQAAG